MLSSGGLRARSSILAKVILGTTCLRTGIALQLELMGVIVWVVRARVRHGT